MTNQTTVTHLHSNWAVVWCLVPSTALTTRSLSIKIKGVVMTIQNGKKLKKRFVTGKFKFWLQKKNVKWEVATTFTSVRERLGAFWYGAVFSTSFKERGECWYSSRNTSKVEIYFISLYVMGIGVIPQKGWRSTLQWNQYPHSFTLMAPMTPLPHPLRCLSFELCHSQGSDDGHWVVSVTP